MSLVRMRSAVVGPRPAEAGPARRIESLGTHCELHDGARSQRMTTPQREAGLVNDRTLDCMILGRSLRSVIDLKPVVWRMSDRTKDGDQRNGRRGAYRRLSSHCLSAHALDAVQQTCRNLFVEAPCVIRHEQQVLISSEREHHSTRAQLWM